MAAFPKLVLTSAGIALQTKVQGGATLELTNIQMGSGQLNGQPIGPLTALISSNATVPIQSGQAIGQNTYQVEGFFTNADLSAGFWWREIGIFANDPDNGEILYAYANAGDAGDYIPTATDQRIEKYIYFSMTLANATTVTVTIPQTDTYVLQSTVGQANGVAGLGGNGAVPVAQGGTGATTPQGALANLGAGVRPNLLINPFFEVNQRGQTSYSGGASYFIDLWNLSNSAMSAQISDDHISITSASTYQNFEQRIENYKELFGKTLTLSALVKGVSGNTVGIAIGNTNTSTGVYFRERFTCTGNWQLITMTFTLSEISSGDTYLAVMCLPEFTNGGTGGTSDWMAAKLEEGSTQTLAYQDDTGAWQLLPQPESDYATQLARCQRYYQIYSTADARPSKAVDCRPVMRTDPAQGTIVVGDTTYYYNTAEL